MSTNTPNFNLEKPSEDEFYDVGVQNSNMDKIDTALKTLADEVADGVTQEDLNVIDAKLDDINQGVDEINGKSDQIKQGVDDIGEKVNTLSANTAQYLPMSVAGGITLDTTYKTVYEVAGKGVLDTAFITMVGDTNAPTMWIQITIDDVIVATLGHSSGNATWAAAGLFNPSMVNVDALNQYTFRVGSSTYQPVIPSLGSGIGISSGAAHLLTRPLVFKKSLKIVARATLQKPGSYYCVLGGLA